LWLQPDRLGKQWHRRRPLDALADNGGPTMTFALESNSPAIDVIPQSDCTDFATGDPLTADQRGMPRPDSEDGSDGNSDIGAYELQEPVTFAGTPGAPNCKGKSVSTLSQEFGTLDAAASALKYRA
jgi:hypothetical protein